MTPVCLSSALWEASGRQHSALPYAEKPCPNIVKWSNQRAGLPALPDGGEKKRHRTVLQAQLMQRAQ